MKWLKETWSSLLVAVEEYRECGAALDEFRDLLGSKRMFQTLFSIICPVLIMVGVLPSHVGPLHSSGKAVLISLLGKKSYADTGGQVVRIGIGYGDQILDDVFRGVV